jgi:hypothetical protein
MIKTTKNSVIKFKNGPMTVQVEVPAESTPGDVINSLLSLLSKQELAGLSTLSTCILRSDQND